MANGGSPHGHEHEKPKKPKGAAKKPAAATKPKPTGPAKKKG